MAGSEQVTSLKNFLFILFHLCYCDATVNGGEIKEIINAISELKSEIAVLREKNESLSKYIYNDLKSEIAQLRTRVEKCMNESARARNRDLKWMIGLMISFVIGTIGWVVVLLKTIV